MAEYEVYVTANIRSDDGLSHFAIVNSQKLELTEFAELDELMARVRNAIYSDLATPKCGFVKNVSDYAGPRVTGICGYLKCTLDIDHADNHHLEMVNQ